jgi:hypothetical protein
MSALEVFAPAMTDAELLEAMERLPMVDVRAIADGRLRLNDRSELDLRLWNAAIDVENGV